MVPWKQIQTVLLDMDGTLLDLSYDNYFWLEYLPQCYARSRGLDVPTAKAVLKPRFKRIEGTLNWYCLDHWRRELCLDVGALKREIAHLITIKPQAVEFLARLRAMGKRLVLVTNAHQDALALKLERTRLHEYLDAIVCAHDFGLAKEQSVFWKRLHETEPFVPQHTLLVDDNLTALRAARDFGIRYLLAVKRPSSAHPAEQTDEFEAVGEFSELLDLADAAR